MSSGLPSMHHCHGCLRHNLAQLPFFPCTKRKQLSVSFWGSDITSRARVEKTVGQQSLPGVSFADWQLRSSDAPSLCQILTQKFWLIQITSFNEQFWLLWLCCDCSVLLIFTLATFLLCSFIYAYIFLCTCFWIHLLFIHSFTCVVICSHSLNVVLILLFDG